MTGAELRFERRRRRVTADLRGDLNDLVRRCRALLDLDADPDAIAAVLGGETLSASGPACGHPARSTASRSRCARSSASRSPSPARGRCSARMAADGPFPRPRRARARERPRTCRCRARAARRSIALASGDAARGDQGVGPWTLALRADALRRPRRLPADRRRGPPRARASGGDAGAAERWRPFRSYAVHHLWADAAATASPLRLPLRPRARLERGLAALGGLQLARLRRARELRAPCATRAADRGRAGGAGAATGAGSGAGRPPGPAARACRWASRSTLRAPPPRAAQFSPIV